MTTPVRHIDCGAIVFWYLGEKGSHEAKSKDVIYLDGSRPSPNSALPLCPNCGVQLQIQSQYTRSTVRRCFEEDLDPGQKVKATITGITMAQQNVVAQTVKPAI